jgi:RNase P/RNase MRP subunit p29
MGAWIAKARCIVLVSTVTGLSACGGYTSVDLGGTVTGLTTDGLVLANGNDTVAIPANATSYKFPNQIGTEASYSVTIASQPAHATCTLANASGNASGVAVNYVNVSCVPLTHVLGGTIAGLTTNGLVLVNGPDSIAVPAGSTSFAFPNQVTEGSVYGVAVLSQPTGLTCQVANGTATMGTADVSNVRVTCQ